MQVGLQAAGFMFGLEAQRMALPARHPLVDIGAEGERARRPRPFGFHLDRRERRIVDRDADLLDRRDQEILVALALEHRGEQLHQRRPSDRRLHVEPGAVGRDAHVEIAAERRIP